MTKQQIFLMYSGNTPFYDKSSDYKFNALSIEIEKQTINGIYKFSDCQLVLKPIAEMEYENWVELSGYVFDLKLVNETALTIRDLLMNGDCAYLSFKSIVKINEWLITHGYALDDTWFTNGIAIKESKHE